MNKKTRELLRENNLLEEQLGHEYRSVLTDIVVYLRSADITFLRQERIRRDITDMFFDGEQRGDSVRDIIGRDYKSFCDDIIDETPKRNFRQKILSVTGDGCLYLSVLLSLWLAAGAAAFLAGSSDRPYLTMTVGNVVNLAIFLFAAVFLVEFISKNSFRTELLRKPFVWGLTAAALAVGIAAGVFLRAELFTVHIAVAAAVVVLFFILHKIISSREE